MNTRWIPLAFPFLLIACASMDRSAGGSSYETENTVAMAVSDTFGRPVVGAWTWLRRSDYVPAGAPEASQGTTDTAGRLRLERVPSGKWRIEVRKDGRSLQQDVVTTDFDLALGVLRLEPWGSISGQAQPGSRVVALGTIHGAWADTAGRFRVDSLPSGLQTLQDASGAHAYVQLNPGGNASAGILSRDSAGTVLLDDFEDGDTRMRYGALTGNGYWYLEGDSTTLMVPPSRHPELAVVTDSAGGHAFHWQATFSGTNSRAWAECGIHFGSLPNGYDLSTLRAVRMRVRGQGTMTARLVGKDTKAGENPETELELASSWKDVELPVDSFQRPTWGSTPLDGTSRVAFLRTAVGLAFALTASGELWIDRLQLIGPSPSIFGASP